MAIAFDVRRLEGNKASVNSDGPPARLAETSILSPRRMQPVAPGF